MVLKKYKIIIDYVYKIYSGKNGKSISLNEFCDLIQKTELSTLE